MGKNKVNDIFVRAVCLLASVALWVLIINTANPTQRMTFQNIPVQIQNGESLLAKGLILVPNQNPTTRVPLEGAANDLYSLNTDSINVTLDINQRTLQAGQQEVQATFVQTPSGVSLAGPNPTVTLEVDEYVRRPVEIKKDRLDYETADGYYVADPQLELNFVTVSGPRTDVDRVAAVKPISQIQGIDRITREVVRLEALDSADQIVPNVTLSEGYVEVTYSPVPVRDIPVEAIWAGTNTAITLTSIRPEPATVRVAGREAILSSLEEIPTVPLDLAEVEPGESTRIKALEVPNEVTILDLNGEPTDPEVEVITMADPIITRDFIKDVAFMGEPDGELISASVPVTVTVSGTQQRLDELSESNIIVSVDVSGLAAGIHQLAVDVDLPKDYVLIRTSPAEISIGIE